MAVLFEFSQPQHLLPGYGHIKNQRPFLEGTWKMTVLNELVWTCLNLEREKNEKKNCQGDHQID